MNTQQMGPRVKDHSFTHVEHIQCRGIQSFEVELTLALNSIKLDFVSLQMSKSQLKKEMSKW